MAKGKTKLYNYFIKTNRGTKKFPTPMNWMDTDTFIEFLKDTMKPNVRYVESFRKPVK